MAVPFAAGSGGMGSQSPVRRRPRPLSSASLLLDEIVQTACELGAHDQFRHGQVSHLQHSSLAHSSTSSAESSSDMADEQVPPASRRRTPPFLVRGQRPRPQVTLRYMQSLDGSLTVPEKSHLPDLQPISPGQMCESVDCAADSVVHFVGRLRSNHDAILIGVNTVLRDDPELQSGHAGARQPQPIILDTDLQFPLAKSKLMRHPKLPWIFCRTGLESDERRAALEAAGLRVFHVPQEKESGHLSLEAVLERLYEEMEVGRVVVEGGVSVLEGFIRQRLFDKVVILMAPCFGVGRALFQQAGDTEALRDQLPRLTNIRYDVLGVDLVMSAEPIY